MKLQKLTKIRDIRRNFFYFCQIVFFYIQRLPKYFYAKINLLRLPKLDTSSNLLLITWSNNTYNSILIIIIWSNFCACVPRYMLIFHWKQEALNTFIFSYCFLHDSINVFVSIC